MSWEEVRLCNFGPPEMDLGEGPSGRVTKRTSSFRSDRKVVCPDLTTYVY